MATSDIRLITVTCDVPVCQNNIACGANPEHARENGWHRVSVMDPDVELDDQHVELRDMCPTCYADLMDFLNGEPEPQLIDVAAGQDWAGVPTPSTEEMTEKPVEKQ